MEPDVESLEFFLGRASTAELKFAIITQRNEIDDLRNALRSEGDRIAELREALELIEPYSQGAVAGKPD